MKFLIVVAITLLIFSGDASAYVGPGLGVGVIGAIVGVFLAIIMAIVGIFWYPIKRLFKKSDDNETLEDAEPTIETTIETATEKTSIEETK